MSETEQNAVPRCVWLTGASSGIGEGLAKHFYQQGSSVVLSARSEDKLESIAASLRQLPVLASTGTEPSVHILPFDVAGDADVQTFRQKLEELAPSLDMVVMSAGACEYLTIEKPDWQMMRRICEVNYLGSVRTVEIAMPLLKQNASASNRAHIVGIASQALLMPFTRAEAYGASKAALHYFLQALRMDVHRQNIDVTSVLPGFVRTPMTDQNNFDMPFLMEVDEAVARIAKGIRSRPAVFAFPRRLYFLLRFFSFFPKLWFRKMQPKKDATQ